MNLRSVAAALALAFPCILSASCVGATPDEDTPSAPFFSTDQATERAEPIGDAPEPMPHVGIEYGSKDFPFVVERSWDGKDGAGGWQSAVKIFEFEIERGGWPFRRVTYEWKCPMKFEMAVQSEIEGHITVSRAAYVTAEIANMVVPALMESRPDWELQGAEFCLELHERLKKAFRSEKFKGYGARVSKP